MAPTATKPKPKLEKARFEAPGRNLRVILEPVKEKFSDSGRKQPVPGTGHTIEFTADGFGAQFFESTDPAVIDRLRMKINEGAPFFEVPIPKPSSQPVLMQIVGLAARGDKDALLALAAEEEETHQREDVLEAIGDALEQIGS